METSQRCHGLRFQEEEYNIVIGPNPTYNVFRRYLVYFSALILLSLLLTVNFKGSHPPQTELEALTIHNFTLTRSPWRANGNVTVIFQARNPSSVLGFRHRYLSTLVMVWYTDFALPYTSTMLGQSEVPQFSLGHKSARDVSANVVFSDKALTLLPGQESRMRNQSNVKLGITVKACVKVKTLGWQDPRWLWLVCSVNTSNVHYYRCQSL